MGRRFSRTTRHNRWGYWEDVDFLRLNIHILRGAGGKWSKVPEPWRILDAGVVLESEIVELLHLKGERQGEKGYRWGWKDPRTVLTIPAIHPHLVSPVYVVVNRDRRAIIHSLSRRHRGSPRRKWVALTAEYLRRLNAFAATVDAPVYRIRFEDLLDKRKVRDEVIKLGWFLGMKRFKTRLIRGVAQVRFGN